MFFALIRCGIYVSKKVPLLKACVLFKYFDYIVPIITFQKEVLYILLY